MTDHPDDLPDDDLGGRSAREVDAALREALGEVAPDRFAELVARAAAEPQLDGLDPADDLAARRLRRGAGGRRSSGAPRWLGLAAAVVLVLGIGAVLVSALGGESPDQQAATPTTRSTLADRTTLPTTPGPPPGARGACRQVPDQAPPPSAPAADRSGTGFQAIDFRCALRSGPSSADRVLLSAEQAFGGAAAPDGQRLCAVFEDLPDGVEVVSPVCAPTPLRATVDRPGTYELRYRVQACAAPARGCGPVSEAVGTLLLVAS